MDKGEMGVAQPHTGLQVQGVYLFSMRCLWEIMLRGKV